MKNSIIFTFIALFSFTTAFAGGHCNENFYFKNIKNFDTFQTGKDIYVKVEAQRSYDIMYMDLFINGYKVRTEQHAPYEWGRPHGGGDHYLRNMKPGTYKLKCVIKTKCNRTVYKEITIYVKNGHHNGGNGNNNCYNNYYYETAKNGYRCQRGTNVYVKVGAQNIHNVEWMELYINGQKIRRENNYPYEWGKSNSNADYQLKNMRPGTYTLECKIYTKCNTLEVKTSTFYVN